MLICPESRGIAALRRAVPRQTRRARLSAYFGTSAEFWTNLHAHYALRIERRELSDLLKTIRPIPA